METGQAATRLESGASFSRGSKRARKRVETGRTGAKAIAQPERASRSEPDNDGYYRQIGIEAKPSLRLRTPIWARDGYFNKLLGVLAMVPERRLHLEQALQRMPAQVTAVCTTHELKEALTNGTRPSFLITDAQIRDASWQDVLFIAHEQHPQLPVLVCTSREEIRSISGVLRSDAAGVLLAPFQERTLRDTLRATMEGNFLRRPRKAPRQVAPELRPTLAPTG